METTIVLIINHEEPVDLDNISEYIKMFGEELEHDFQLPGGSVILEDILIDYDEQIQEQRDRKIQK